MQSLWTGRRGRDLREYLTAYLMVLPSLILIFTFGLFPVLFAVYVSLHKWKIKQGAFVGLQNYTKAIDVLAYLLFFGVALGLAYLAWQTVKNIIQQAHEKNERPWAFFLPGMLYAGAVLLFMRYVVLLIPEVLSIADKVRGQKRSRELFLQLLKEAFHAEQVVLALRQWLGIFVLAVVVTWLVWRWVRAAQRMPYLSQIFTAWLAASISGITAWFTVSQIFTAMQAAREAGETGSPVLGQTLSIAAGLVLLVLAWKFWQSAVAHPSDKAFIGRGLAALFLLVGGWILIGELPMAIGAGDADLWLGLKVTVFYAMGTIPFQLGFALVLAYLLFQQIRGKEFFRVIFFLPYITPAVASASVFRLMFGPRSASPINALITLFGGESQKWLMEPRGVFSIIGSSLGLNLPAWAAGPSLALVVIIIYSIWTFVGYDTVIYLAGLGNISTEINEAAAIDGASRWQIFRNITLPLLSPTTYFLSLIAVIGTFKAFNHIYVMRDAMALGTVDTFSVAIFDVFFQRSRFGYASAMAFILFAIILALTYVNNKVQGSRVFYG